MYFVCIFLSGLTCWYKAQENSRYSPLASQHMMTLQTHVTTRQTIKPIETFFRKGQSKSAKGVPNWS
jgi:hypothetical protein